MNIPLALYGYGSAHVSLSDLPFQHGHDNRPYRHLAIVTANGHAQAMVCKDDALKLALELLRFATGEDEQQWQF